MTATTGAWLRRRRPWVAGLAAVALATIVAGAWRATPVQAISLLPLPDTLTAVHDRATTVAAPGVLANDVGLGGGTIAILDTPPAHGTVDLRADGGYTYRPDAGYVGTDQFWYHPSGLIVTPTAVTIIVTNDAPTARDDAYQALTGIELAVPAPGVLANDLDGDGDRLAATLVDGGGNGSLSLDQDGGFTFKSGGSFTGPRTFTYRVSDGLAWSAVATVTIDVRLPSASPTPRPILPLPTLPLPTLPPLPTIGPTPSPTPAPTKSSDPNPTPTATAMTPASALPSPTPASPEQPAPSTETPPGGGAGSVGGDPSPGPDSGSSGGGSPPDRRLAVGRAGAGSIDVAGDLELTGLGSMADWAVPALALSVPGLLVLLAILAQALGGLLWLPVTRRWLGGFGLGRRRARRSNPA